MALVKIVATVLSLLLLLCCFGVESRALLGSTLLDVTSNENGTSILAALALAHAQHTINKLEQLAELISLGQNVTASLLIA